MHQPEGPSDFLWSGVGVLLVVVGAVLGSVVGVVLILAGIALAVFRELQPLAWWWGADFWVDHEGVHFGIARDSQSPKQPTQYRGYLPAKGRALLVMHVDPDMVRQPWVMQPRSSSDLTMMTSRVWAFSVKDVAPVREAFAAQGVVLECICEPVQPSGF